MTEPTKRNAIHGFLRWRNWGVMEREPHRVVMGTTIHPLEGYPFALAVSVAYELGDGGLTVTTVATNVGDQVLPFASGQHPYLSPGSGSVDECSLELDAGTRILTDPERQLPTGTEPVSGTDFDFRSPRRLGDQRLDFAFTDLGRDEAGRAWVRLAAPDSGRAELWVDRSYPFVELYTGDTLDEPRRRRWPRHRADDLSAECIPDGGGAGPAQPGETATSSWGARLA